MTDGIRVGLKFSKTFNHGLANHVCMGVSLK